MKKEFYFYNCKLVERQLRLGVSGLLPAKEVVRAICDADFQDNNLLLNGPKTNTNYYHEFAKRPKKGLYLIKAKKTTDHSFLDILIDTRLFPNFILIEKHDDRLQSSNELVCALEESINQAAEKYGWHVELIENDLNVIRDIDLFISAMAYVDEKADFRSFILYEERTEEIMAMLHLKIDKKIKAPTIMCVLKAAIDAGLISKPHYKLFIMEFGKADIISLSTYKGYTKVDNNPLVHDKVYQEYLEQFLRMKDKWLDEISKN